MELSLLLEIPQRLESKKGKKLKIFKKLLPISSNDNILGRRFSQKVCRKSSQERFYDIYDMIVTAQTVVEGSGPKEETSRCKLLNCKFFVVSVDKSLYTLGTRPQHSIWFSYLAPLEKSRSRPCSQTLFFLALGIVF